MFTKYVIKMEMFVAVNWSNGELFASIVRNIPLGDLTVVKI